MKRVLITLGVISSFVLIGTTCFFIGSNFGPRAQMADFRIKAEGDGETTVYLALYEDDWSAQEIAEAVCGTRTELKNFSQTYALSGTGSHYVFSCSEPGKEQS